MNRDMTMCVNKECEKTDCMRHHTKGKDWREKGWVYVSHFNENNEPECKYYAKIPKVK